jgi:hypothetical protein
MQSVARACMCKLDGAAACDLKSTGCAVRSVAQVCRVSTARLEVTTTQASCDRAWSQLSPLSSLGLSPRTHTVSDEAMPRCSKHPIASTANSAAVP